MAGLNDVDGFETEWVCSMGHLIGLFDEDWLGIPSTGKMGFLRYVEFHRITGGKISETALFCDIISVMQQAGQNPLPLQTGAAILTPGPRTHDGLLFDKQDPAEGKKTQDLINRMISDLTSAGLRSSQGELAETWHDDMIWFGPAGIGATYTLERYEEQHQEPFGEGLADIEFHGHVCRLAEGNYGGFFGWANLSMKPGGGFIGLPASDKRAEMRVVDIYRRDGDKLAENWVFIDLLHFLSMQGLDVLGRMNHITFRTFKEPVFVGLSNYVEVLADPAFWTALRWNLLIIVIVVPAHIIVAFVAALLLDQVAGRMRGFYLAGMLIPMMVVPVIGTVVFRQMFEPAGLLGWFLRVVLGGPFLFTETSMKVLILIHTIWISSPFALVIFFAGLQTLPRELVDAAAIDGANWLKQIRHIVIPHLRSLFLLNAIIAVMDFFRLFDNVFVLTRMNPIFHADTMQTYLFRMAMTVKRLGKANAGAVLTVVLIMVALIPFLILLYREQIEER